MPFVAGNHIQAFCSKCKADKEQVVLELWEGQVRKVRCTACDHEGTYKRPHHPDAAVPEKSKGAGGKEKKKKRGKAAQPKDEWKEALAGKENEEAKPYVPAETYKANERLDHAAFGIGVVMRVISATKMEVLFKEGRKIMVCGRKI